MSNPFKAIGKVFKGIVKVVKKVALPALAIGAAVLTGGSALGILPSMTHVLGGLGLSAGLTSVLSAAGQGALTGMIGSAITGGNILKGAETGFAIGGITGGLGQAFKPATSMSTTGSTINNAASTTGATTSNFGIDPTTQSAINASAGGNSLGLGSALKAPTLSQSMVTTPLSVTSQPIAPVGNFGVDTATQSAVDSAATMHVTPPAPGGGFLPNILGENGLLNRNPYLTAGLIQGLGAGISASAQLKAQREQEQRMADNYRAGPEGFYTTPSGMGSAIGAQPRYRWEIDPVSGQPVQKRVS